MLGLCGNGDMLKPLMILQQSFPLIGEVESANITDKQNRRWLYGESTFH